MYAHTFSKNKKGDTLTLAFDLRLPGFWLSFFTAQKAPNRCACSLHGLDYIRRRTSALWGQQ
jgi:hypothetical protein